MISAGHKSSPDSKHALESLCETYWYPLYAYVRRRVPDVPQSTKRKDPALAVSLYFVIQPGTSLSPMAINGGGRDPHYFGGLVAR